MSRMMMHFKIALMCLLLVWVAAVTGFMYPPVRGMVHVGGDKRVNPPSAASRTLRAMIFKKLQMDAQHRRAAEQDTGGSSFWPPQSPSNSYSSQTAGGDDSYMSQHKTGKRIAELKADYNNLRLLRAIGQQGQYGFAVCQIETWMRQQCGQAITDQYDCEARGCCWSPANRLTPQCYHARR